ncbi:MAG TPA: tetratricopeptide repeat protein [Polyangia bacterium]
MTPGGPTLDEELEAARRALRAGDVATATARLEALRQQAPDHPRVAAGLVQAYLKRGRVDAALAVAADAAARTPSSYHALVALGQARKAARDLAGAREAFERARAAADNAFVSTQLGRVLLGLGEAQAALDVALTARRRLAAAPREGEAKGDPALLTLEGDALARLGRHDEAARAYAAAQALAPDDPLAHKRLLEARLHDLPLDEAIAELEALARVPAYAGRAYLHELRGKRLYDAGRHAEAAAAYEAALALDPGSAFTREQLGFAANRAGDHERAVQALRPSFLATPGNKYVRSTLMAALRKLGRLDELRAVLDEAIAAHPQDFALKAERRRLGAEGEPEPAPRPRKPRVARTLRAATRDDAPELPGLGAPPRPKGKPRG